MGNKYGNKKTIVDGIMFDSALEARYYQELVLRKRAGDILDFEIQPVFVLQEGFTFHCKKERPITYVADFAVTRRDGFLGTFIEVVDCKGMKTDAYRMKRKMFLKRYCETGNYTFTEITKEDVR